MVGELITLPVRVGVRVTRLWFRAVEETVSVTSSATGRLIGALAARNSNGAGGRPTGAGVVPDGVDGGPAESEVARSEATAFPPETTPPPEETKRPSADPTPTPAQTEAERGETATTPTPREPAPQTVHVSEETEVVEEFAEPGAEQGAGAEIHVDPPWDDYEQMSAKQVISRLAGADPAALAAVELYESSHRRRQTILKAALRELRSVNSGRSHPNQR